MVGGGRVGWCVRACLWVCDVSDLQNTYACNKRDSKINVLLEEGIRCP